MTTKDMTDLQACEFAAGDRWLIEGPLEVPVPVLLIVSQMVPGPVLINSKLIKYTGTDRVLLAIFTASDRFVCAWRQDIATERSTAMGFSPAVFMVRLFQGNPVTVPDTIAELGDTNGS